MASDFVERLHLHHLKLKEILKDIQILANESNKKTTEISEKLKIFSKLFVKHIYLEDANLYPKIFKNLKNDQMGIKSINMLLNEIKITEDQAVAFLNKYNRSEINPNQQFKSDLDSIILILEARIKLEDECIMQYW